MVRNEGQPSVVKVYTKTGDTGDTGYLGKGRIRKDSPRIHAVGCLDETNCAIGVVLTGAVDGSLRPVLVRIQHGLFEAGAAMASADPTAAASYLDAETRWLEEAIDELEARLEPLRNFILPGGSATGARLHWARAVARNAERYVVEASEGEEDRISLIRFVNRLSDALFMMARRANQLEGNSETTWESSSKES